MAPRIISVCNLKGGVGKSTVAVNVACALASRSRTVELIDADEQGTAAHWASQGELPVRVEHKPLEGRGADAWVRSVLASEADGVVIDAPPHVGDSTQAIVAISDVVLVPVSPSGADLLATMRAVELVRQARQVRGDGGPACLLVPSRVDQRTSASRELPAALKALGEPVGPAVRLRTAHADAFGVGQWVGDFAPGSDADADIRALASKVWLLAREGGA